MVKNARPPKKINAGRAPASFAEVSIDNNMGNERI